MGVKKLTWIRKNLKEILIDILVFGFAAMVLVGAGVLIWVATLEIPDLSAFEERRVLQSTKIFDRTGEILLYDLHQDVRRTIIPLENMSRHIKNATVAIEDDQFYNHFGIDIRAIIRAAIINFQAGETTQGGSTITQQVIKNSVLEREQTLTRKVKEAILSIKLERELSKDQILETYLNESPYGGTIYGVEEASRAFFGKPANDLTIAEAAYLAAIPQAPTYYSPYGNNTDALAARQKLVLDRMRLNGFITVEEYEAAQAEEVVFEPQLVSGIRAPHFVMYIREQLANRYGEEALAVQGYRVITSLDWELQKEAERIVAERAANNTERFNASNAGLVATDPKTGDVLVMVGSKDYFSEDIDGNFNVALANRQPGSSIKPFVYASAFRKGYLPATIVFDVKTQFSPLCEPSDPSSESPCYSPNNYNGEFLGPISLRNALAQSLNIPAVKTLYLAGLQDSLKLAADMGLTTLNDPDRYGLTLVLGGGEVRLLDMTHAYGVFANRGVRAEPRSILRVENTRGEVVEDFGVNTNRVLEENIADMVTDVLSDDVARTPLWGARGLLYFGNRDVAGKSGSTNNLRDAWIMGYTPNLAVGAWVGNNDNTEMGGGLSGLITTPMWREFMEFALERVEPESFTQPQINTVGLKPILRGQYIDTAQVLESLAGSGDGATVSLGNIYNNIHNILHYVNKNNPQGPYPTNPSLQDDQYDNWEFGVQQWKESTFGALLEATEPSQPEEDDDSDGDRRNTRRNRDD
jgi:1A family penicillin-binding protein